MEKKLGEGLRHNENKTRYDLLPVYATEQFAKVLTKGSEKYAPRNWEAGMDWSKCLASLKRHIAAFERGEDFDQESSLLHMAHAMCNAAFIVEYYKIYPQGDDRQHSYLSTPKIGLDVDDVLADFIGHWTQYFGVEFPEVWNFDRHIKDKLKQVKNNKKFWMTMPVKTKPSDIHFEPHCYITSRVCSKEITEAWLDKNGFPQVPVYSTDMYGSKVDAVKESGLDIFVDDRFENFRDINNAGICCFLFDAAHNRRYTVGYKRIKFLYELTNEQPTRVQEIYKELESAIDDHLSLKRLGLKDY